MNSYSPQYRPSAKPRRISEIKTADEQIQVVGLIVDKRESSIVLDDGSGRINVLFEDPGLVKDVDVGSKVRVFGTPLNIEDTHEIHAEIIQKLDKLDLDLYKKVIHEVRKFEKELQQ
ncbi:hypothetical protein AKJ50_01435 [candidate division MSBL1 archaeon SCGC-AAA382A13]|uniref:OB domain-containing protein n=1 Tax=candidate division MSBL1 archaeon SCGC-AAA382A13 TaxID=1698279 RepID=A0A133VFK7_9EURY|nr:hypothetical protein AKJ50_01435 [candidate division MSBL1 archaeon SCGC-AAA382A13]